MTFSSMCTVMAIPIFGPPIGSGKNAERYSQTIFDVLDLLLHYVYNIYGNITDEWYEVRDCPGTWANSSTREIVNKCPAAGGVYKIVAGDAKDDLEPFDGVITKRPHAKVDEDEAKFNTGTFVAPANLAEMTVVRSKLETVNEMSSIDEPAVAIFKSNYPLKIDSLRVYLPDGSFVCLKIDPSRDRDITFGDVKIRVAVMIGMKNERKNKKVNRKHIKLPSGPHPTRQNENDNTVDDDDVVNETLPVDADVELREMSRSGPSRSTDSVKDANVTDDDDFEYDKSDDDDLKLLPSPHEFTAESPVDQSLTPEQTAAINEFSITEYHSLFGVLSYMSDTRYVSDVLHEWQDEGACAASGAHITAGGDLTKLSEDDKADWLKYGDEITPPPPIYRCFLFHKRLFMPNLDFLSTIVTPPASPVSALLPETLLSETCHVTDATDDVIRGWRANLMPMTPLAPGRYPLPVRHADVAIHALTSFEGAYLLCVFWQLYANYRRSLLPLWGREHIIACASLLIHVFQQSCAMGHFHDKCGRNEHLFSEHQAVFKDLPFCTLCNKDSRIIPSEVFPDFSCKDKIMIDTLLPYLLPSVVLRQGGKLKGVEEDILKFHKKSGRPLSLHHAMVAVFQLWSSSPAYALTFIYPLVIHGMTGVNQQPKSKKRQRGHVSVKRLVGLGDFRVVLGDDPMSKPYTSQTVNKHEFSEVNESVSLTKPAIYPVCMKVSESVNWDNASWLLQALDVDSILKCDVAKSNESRSFAFSVWRAAAVHFSDDIDNETAVNSSRNASTGANMSNSLGTNATSNDVGANPDEEVQNRSQLTVGDITPNATADSLMCRNMSKIKYEGPRGMGQWVKSLLSEWTSRNLMMRQGVASSSV